ncbi:type II toxin-antitoxin system VapC family toxin [Pasteurella atlantica]|uniref:Type II toxin-antitoxin system VapC family toxin n=2 Tax=Pasteurellaceae TaxID=712 RepID=A0ACC6HQ31_9PAST|nr:type II toxin-antitoxin system VapC family toxin [Pasteurella atlantica]MDP8034552.1 type II toxin-antitoxin system VapC family toxin [Pasteurella atlantica]MDP8036502.1 type II toxin-antitoxin system VapC family toxin [Pasteurella atlantica]MDP8038430.1 type II toxin-antitoxin system VapC family toxin [Pasteurella atlantica]MDP8048799.1 type II toxin-antitoxin system VapC family toxin [Pasteurella atlantica]MDP8050767.1 type II toxin-antitoxin system VapC family toxin [Pasteurella atlantic
MLIDTDVLIWYLRGNENAYKTIETAGNFQISVITYMELVQGMRNKQELAQLHRAFKLWGTKILYVSEDISTKAMFYVEQYYLSHSIQLADSLIGATAAAYNIPLLTGNDKHYKMMKDIEIQVFRP